MLGLLCLCLNVSVEGWAQSASQPIALAEVKGPGKISGVLTDSLTGKPVEFATVALLQNGKNLDGTLTDSRGHFTFSHLRTGTYELNFSFIGYNAKNLKSIIITEKDPEVIVGNTKLSPAATKLQEVTVVGQKPLIEDKIDRLIYNADQDLTNTGGNAADVLQKVPSLTVDADGNVQLRGSGNVRVLLNGKPSPFLANNLAEALKQIPSDQIKSVEVITSPSAKYDAEGTAGIINIITKKSFVPGLNGNVGLTLGNRNSSLSSSLYARRGKFGTNLSLSGFQYNVPKGFGMYRKEFREGEDVVTTQTGGGRVYGGGGNVQLGLEYDLDSVNLLSAGVQLNTGRYKGDGSQKTITSESGPYQQIGNNTHNQFSPLSADINFGYTRIIKPKQELTVLGQFSQFKMESFIDQNRHTLGDQQLYYLQHNTNQSMNRETTLQTDYVHPFTDKSTLEVGVKSIFRRAYSNTQYQVHYPLEDRQDLEDNNFNYTQDVAAGYLSYKVTLLKNYAAIIGVRYEHTRLKGAFTSTQTNLDESYQHIIPSLAVSRTFKENHTLKLSYTQRLQRPHIFLLNPYRDIRDPKSVFYGNPKLAPELSHLYEIGYSTFFKTSSVSTALYVRKINNAIQQVTPEIIDGISQNTFANAGKLLSYGLNVSGSTKPVPALNLNGNLNLYYNQINGLGMHNSGWQYNLSFSTGYDFGKGFSGQFSGGFNSPRVLLQGQSLSWSYYNLAVKKELFDKRGSVSLGVNNPFTKSINYGQQISTAVFEQTNDNINFNRGIRISFDFKFGQQSGSKPPRKKKTIKNDDMKEGA